MHFIDRNVLLNKILNDEPISNIWVLDPNDIKGTLAQIKDGRGYLIFKQVSRNMKIEDIRKEGLVFIEFDNETKETI